jgi:predicted NAD-dependent protein-ADP-ribosyltransferase YbiA (DUF1768 family)
MERKPPGASLAKQLKLKRPRDEDLQKREGESSADFINRMMQSAEESRRKLNETVARRTKEEAVAWDSTYEDDAGRVGGGSTGSIGTRRTPWLCGTFPSIAPDRSTAGADLVFDGAPTLEVSYGGRVFGSAAAAFAFAKAIYFDHRLGENVGANKQYKDALDVPPEATPVADAFPASIPAFAAVHRSAKAGIVAAIVAAPSTGKKHTKAKAGRLHDEIEADWVNDEEDIKAMRVVLASKFSDANPAFRDLLLATGDKDLYVQGFATRKDDKIWELGAHEPDVTTSGLGLYGDLLMERRAELREASA